MQVYGLGRRPRVDLVNVVITDRSLSRKSNISMIVYVYMDVYVCMYVCL